MTARITCKPCGKVMDRLEWMVQKECENPNCRCPEVAKLRVKTQEVIEKAKGDNVQSVKRNTIPTGYDDKTHQYMVDVPDVMVVDIIVPKTNFGHKRKQ